MKRSLLALVLAAVLCLTSCSGGSGQMTVKPSEFSEDTEYVLQIIDNEISFFDYKVSDLIRSVSVDIWNCVDGEWRSVGKCYGNLDSREGRLAVRMLDGSWDIFFIDEDGNSKASYKGEADFSSCTSTAGFRLTQPTQIEPGKAITLWSKLGYDSNGGASAVEVSADFRDSGCTTGTAATVTFSSDVVD